MRLFSSILFALMAMVLPMAGVQHYFCTTSMAFVAGADDCPVEKNDCCGKKGEHPPTTLDCLVSTKLLPDAGKSSPLQIPLADAWSIVPASESDPFPTLRIEIISPEKDRGPPDLPGLYLLQRRLLI